MEYNKPPKSPEELAYKLVNNNLLQGISLENLTKILYDVSYYRLKGYLHPYYSNNTFSNSITWDNIWSDYNFDLELRNLFYIHISKIEISIRTNVINTFSIEYGNNWYNNEALFFAKDRHYNDLQEIINHWNRSNEIFKINFTIKYSNMPPAWMIFETTSFGNLSKFYENFIKNNVKQKIAEHYGFNKSTEHILISWIKHLVYIRNIIAHHGRLFSKIFTTKPIVPKNIFKYLLDKNVFKSDKLFFTVLIIMYLLKYSNNDYLIFKNDFIKLLEAHPLLNHHSMGLPANYKIILDKFIENFLSDKNILFQ